MVDDHPMEQEAMGLFRKGEGKKASQLQDEFLEEIRKSGIDHCTCPGACKFHGKCVECVIIHRGHGDHLPHCFREMVNRRIEAVSGLSENTFEHRTGE